MINVLSIIVTYNRKELLSECIDNLSNSSYQNDILIIDNNSTDGTKDLFLYDDKSLIEIDGNNIYISRINNIKKDIYYCKMDNNLGGAGGYNIGLKIGCLLNDYDYLWLMDDDCIVKNDSLENLIKASVVLNDKWSFLSSKVLWKDGSVCKTNVQRKKVAKKISDFTTPIVKVDYASFVSLLVKKSDVNIIGLPIKDFFIWSDDLEWTRRLTMYPYKNKYYLNNINIDLEKYNYYLKKYVNHNGYLINSSIVVHKCKLNIGVDISKDSKDRIERYKYIYRNDVYVFKKEGLKGILFLIIRYFYHIYKILISRKDIRYKIQIMTKGYIEGIKYNPIIEYV